MSYTSHDFLDAARRAIPEISVEAVAARRMQGDEMVLLDVREKEEVRAGYIAHSPGFSGKITSH
jgi:rhodanese-related sulfurtransferase